MGKENIPAAAIGAHRTKWCVLQGKENIPAAAIGAHRTKWCVLQGRS